MLTLASRAMPVCHPSASTPSGSIMMVNMTSTISPAGRTFTSPNSSATRLPGSCLLGTCGGAFGLLSPPNSRLNHPMGALLVSKPGDGRPRDF
jgi:hypothetical protein